MLNKTKEKQLTDSLEEKGYEDQWSLCKVKVGEEFRYFFRVINETGVQESSDIDCAKCIVDYLLDLPDKKIDKKVKK